MTLGLDWLVSGIELDHSAPQSILHFIIEAIDFLVTIGGAGR
jgi:hypothetical protein